MINGIINVYKEQGYTSHDVVAKLRGILKQKKIGHTGTLDPGATGVLPVCLGRATKVCGILTDADKKYEAVMLLGQTTDTEDASGEIISRASDEQIAMLGVSEIKKTIMGFVGSYNQIPPMYSAVKVNGKRLYELARDGKEVARSARQVRIISINIADIELPRVRFEVECSKGTYIRTLCSDIGQKLGCGACMERLKRTRAAGFKADDALTLTEIEELAKRGELDEKIFPIDSIFHKYRRCVVAEKYNVLIYNGNKFSDAHTSEAFEFNRGEKVRVYDESQNFIGIYEYNGHIYKPLKMFLDIK